MPNVSVIGVIKENAEKGWKGLLPLLNSLPLETPNGDGGDEEEESDSVALSRDSIFNYGLHPSMMEGKRHYYMCNQCKVPLKAFNVKQHMKSRHPDGGSGAATSPVESNAHMNSNTTSLVYLYKKNSLHFKRSMAVPMPPLFPKNSPPHSTPSQSTSVEEMPPPVLHPETTVPEPIAKPPDLNHSKAEVRKLLSGGGYGTDPKVVSLTVTLKTIPILPTPPLPTTASIIVSLPNPKNTSAVLPISALELARKTTDKDKKGHIASKGYVEAKLTAATSPKENVSKRRARQTRSTRSNKKDHNLDKQSTVKDKGPWAPRKPNQSLDKKKTPSRTKSNGQSPSDHKPSKEKNLHEGKNCALPRASAEPPPGTPKDIKGFQWVSDPVTKSSVPETLPLGMENSFVEAATLPACDLEANVNLSVLSKDECDSKGRISVQLSNIQKVLPLPLGMENSFVEAATLPACDLEANVNLSVLSKDECDSKGRISVQLSDIQKVLPTRPILLQIPEGSVLPGLKYTSHPKPMTMRAFPYVRRFAHVHEQQAREDMKGALKRPMPSDDNNAAARDAKQSKAASPRMNGFLFRPQESTNCFQDNILHLLKQFFFSDLE